MNSKTIMFFIGFGIMNLIFIPLLSLYGLRVCPVLSIPGFGFGCYYATVFIVTSNILNVLLVFLFLQRSDKFPFLKSFTNLNWFLVVIYLIATVASLIILQILLKINHLSSSSRAPEILIFASILLGVTQSYGLQWALSEKYSAENEQTKFGFQSQWFSHIARTMFPVLVVSALLLHFIFSQSLTFNNNRTAPIVSQDDFIKHIAYVILFLVMWLLITLWLHFLSERQQVDKIQNHVDQLGKLDFSFRSGVGSSWGLWSAILDQLNSFSKILGERTRLLKSFSRFVASGVAEKALEQELKEATGASEELTVIMSDIRNFTGISELLAPQAVVTLLNEYFSAMLDVISRYQVHVDKFIGDGILAYVEPKEENKSISPQLQNQMAVDAALTMIEAVEELNIKLQSMNLPAIKIGVGIFRGPLIIGLIGSEAKLQHTIIGDTVNRAARLEGLCKDLGVSIVISGIVYDSLNHSAQMRFKSFGKQSMKGITETIEVYGGPV